MLKFGQHREPFSWNGVSLGLKTWSRTRKLMSIINMKTFLVKIQKDKLTIERVNKTNVKYLMRSTWKTLSQVHLIMKGTTYVLVNLSSPCAHIPRVSNEVKKSATSIYGTYGLHSSKEVLMTC